jgi:23S rRNA G2069 N7-methylase RlmK/C1962 C5-methylase RlmI
MIHKVMDLLAEDGLLIFSTNYRRFELDEKVLTHNFVKDISAATLDKDFSRNKKIHRCWEIRKTQAMQMAQPSSENSTKDSTKDQAEFNPWLQNS